jgi:hypothetical protein
VHLTEANIDPCNTTRVYCFKKGGAMQFAILFLAREDEPIKYGGGADGLLHK